MRALRCSASRTFRVLPRMPCASNRFARRAPGACFAHQSRTGPDPIVACHAAVAAEALACLLEGRKRFVLSDLRAGHHRTQPSKTASVGSPWRAVSRAGIRRVSRLHQTKQRPGHQRPCGVRQSDDPESKAACCHCCHCCHCRHCTAARRRAAACCGAASSTSRDSDSGSGTARREAHRKQQAGQTSC